MSQWLVRAVQSWRTQSHGRLGQSGCLTYLEIADGWMTHCLLQWNE